MAKSNRSNLPHHSHMAQYLFVLWFLAVLTFSLPQVQAAMSSVKVGGLGAVAIASASTTTNNRTITVTSTLDKSSYPNYVVSYHANLAKTVNWIILKIYTSNPNVLATYNGQNALNGILIQTNGNTLINVPVSFTNNTQGPVSVGAKVTTFDKSGKAGATGDSGALTLSGSIASITVISPNGGETFYDGQPMLITWKTSNFGSAGINLNLINKDGLVDTAIAQNIPNTGSYSWIIPSIGSLGTTGSYEIQAFAYSKDPGAMDTSDSLFNIIFGSILKPISTSTTIVKGSSTDDDQGTFTIKFSVTANDRNIYVPTVARLYSDTTAPSKVSVRVERSGADVLNGVYVTMINTTDTDVTPNGNYLIQVGETENLEVTSTVQLPAAGPAGLYRMVLSGVNWNDTDVPVSDMMYVPDPDKFKTSYISLN